MRDEAQLVHGGIEMSNSVVVPSLEAEAAEEAARFIASANPQLARDFIQHMRKRGEQRRAEHKPPHAGGRIRKGYMQWAQWMEPATRVSQPLKDPVEAVLFRTKSTTAAQTAQVDLGQTFLREVEKQEAQEKAEVEAKRAFLLETSQLATEKLQELNTSSGLSEIARLPEVVHHYHNQDGVSTTSTTIFVYSYTVKRYGREVRHDYRANGLPVTTKHPQMLTMEDGQRLIRSRDTDDGKVYVKVLEYQDGMYFRGYFHVSGSASDVEDLTCYYQVNGDRIVKITAAEYQRLENLRASGYGH